ncbi:MAG: RNase H-like domain-containing protein, partial [Candidatus Thiodiazotropha taylori]|nr:DDE-type integrase/transposase/recombinase [Candidatus Thiodiazotropha taylori]MCW4285897.1 RNase H-like domain-containing protein [Candidatus Thiodiazotropha taylori]
NFSTVAEPLRRLLKQNEQFIWGEEQRASFDKLKRLLASADTLGYYDVNAKTQVITDASPVGLGALLVQEQEGEYRVICYASRSLTDIERRYSQTEKEALAIVWACERLHPYLYGIQFELLTDHKPLEFIYSPKSKPCARIERWVLRMQQYKYTVKWIPGSMNIADSLSRLLPHSAKKTTQRDDDNEYIRFVAEEATPKAISTKEIERASDDDSELSSIRECLLTNRWYSIENKQYLPVRFELSAIGKLVLRGTRIVIPESLRDRILTLAHEGHPGIVNMKKILRSKIWWPGIDRQVEQFCKSCYRCQLVSQTTKPEPMARTELPAGPWQHLAADLLGPLPTGESILVLVDYYSRFFEVEIMKSTTSDKVIKAINKFFVTHGLPLSLQTDNGPQFVSESFKNFLSENGITHRRTTPL